MQSENNFDDEGEWTSLPDQVDSFSISDASFLEAQLEQDWQIINSLPSPPLPVSSSPPPLRSDLTTPKDSSIDHTLRMNRLSYLTASDELAADAFVSHFIHDENDLDRIHHPNTDRQGLVESAERVWGIQIVKKAFSFPFIEDPSLTGAKLFRREHGNAITLPLELIKTLRISSVEPVFLRISRPSNPRLALFTGLEEFYPADAVYCPSRILKHFHMEEGEFLDITRTPMRPVSKLTLRPLSRSYIELLNPKAALERLLAQWPCIATGDVLTVYEAGQDHEYQVLSVEPESFGHLLDHQVEIDFDIPPELQPPAIISVPLSTASHHISRLDQPLAFVYLPSSESQHHPIKISVTAVAGDPDLFISQTETRPRATTATWSAITVGDVEFALSPDVGWDPEKPVFFSVIPDGQETEFHLLVTLHSGASAGSSSTPSSSSPTSSSSSPSSPAASSPGANPTASAKSAGIQPGDHRLQRSRRDEPLKPGYVKCDRCQLNLPERSLMMHQRGCLQSFFCTICEENIPNTVQATHLHCPSCPALAAPDHVHCPEPQCALVMRPIDIPKHIKHLHTPIRCRCGVTLKPSEMKAHDASDCPFRKLTCPSCDGVFLAAELAFHLPDCAASRLPTSSTAPKPTPPPVSLPDSAVSGAAFTCPYCDLALEGDSPLQEHLMSCPRATDFLLSQNNRDSSPQVPTQEYLCPFCNLPQGSVLRLEMHLPRCIANRDTFPPLSGRSPPRDRVCMICHTAFPTEISFSNHLRRCQNRVPATSPPSDPQGTPDDFNCPLCQLSFLTQNSLEAHVNRCVGLSTPRVPSPPPPALDHICPICSVDFPTLRSLETHLNTCGSSTRPDDQPYIPMTLNHICSNCLVGYSTSEALLTHSLTCQPSPHFCSVCQRSMPTEKDLISHFASCEPRPPSGSIRSAFFQASPTTLTTLCPYCDVPDSDHHLCVTKQRLSQEQN